MGDKPSPKGPYSKDADARKARLANALRDNLKRRKRARTDRADGEKTRKSADSEPSAG